MGSRERTLSSQGALFGLQGTEKLMIHPPCDAQGSDLRNWRLCRFGAWGAGIAIAHGGESGANSSSFKLSLPHTQAIPGAVRRSDRAGASSRAPPNAVVGSLSLRSLNNHASRSSPSSPSKGMQCTLSIAHPTTFSELPELPMHPTSEFHFDTPDQQEDLRVDNTQAVKKEQDELQAVEVAFSRDDPENPQDGWSTSKRWRVLLIALFITFTSTFNSTAQGAASAGFRKEHPSVTSEVFLTSNFAYQLMLGVGPLFLAPISETYGRRPMLVVLSFLVMVLFLPQALAPNFPSILITRFIQGVGGSVEGPVVAGIVADLFTKKNRGTAMGTFVVAVYAGNGMGPMCANWIAFKVNWHWVYWLQMIMGAVAFLLVVFFLPETRGELLLSKRATALTKETGRPHYVRGSELVGTETWGERIKLSLTRPLLYLFTEPIVAISALWIGTAWGVVFLLVGAVAHVFTITYGFNQGQASSVLVCGLIGAIIGWFTNEYIQERLYRNAVEKGHGRAKPEARLYSSAVGGLLFGVGAFGFAWTARPWIHWIAPAIFITIANLGLYTIYLATYNYLGDVYDRYSSSAQAAQSLLRGVLGACFPFFGIIMYDKLTFKWASTLVGFVALGFASVPFLMFRFGPSLRARSKIAVHLSHAEGMVLGEDGDAQVEA